MGQDRSSRTKLPATPERFDGAFEHRDTDSDQVTIEGTFSNGRMVGTWNGYWPSGQLRWTVAWSKGTRQGPIHGFHENGEKHYVGQYDDDGLKHGLWEYWYDDGAFHQRYECVRGKQNGPYVCDERDGSPRARGQYRKGNMNGAWEWRNQNQWERVSRFFIDGVREGVSEAWYRGGQLAHRIEFSGGKFSGAYEEYNESGAPTKVGRYAKGGRLVRMETYDAAGNKTVEEGEPLPCLPQKLLDSPKKLAQLGARVAKGKDESKKEAILEKAAGDWSLVHLLLLHLFREGHYELGADPQMWNFALKGEECFSGEDVAKLLKTANPDDAQDCPHLPGWPTQFEQLVMRVYPRDPEPIEASLPSLSDALAAGVKSCLLRFGREVSLEDQSQRLARAVVNHPAMGRALWPSDGALEWHPFFENAETGPPTEHLDRFVELTADVDRYVTEPKSGGPRREDVTPPR